MILTRLPLNRNRKWQHTLQGFTVKSQGHGEPVISYIGLALKKGLKSGFKLFCSSQKNPVGRTENAIKNLRENTVEETRQECTIVLRRSKPPKSNMKKEDLNALRNMRKNKDITIVKADKGNATVVLDKVENNR
jgi:hypothetical protein